VQSKLGKCACLCMFSATGGQSHYDAQLSAAASQSSLFVILHGHQKQAGTSRTTDADTPTSKEALALRGSKAAHGSTTQRQCSCLHLAFPTLYCTAQRLRTVSHTASTPFLYTPTTKGTDATRQYTAVKRYTAVQLKGQCLAITHVLVLPPGLSCTAHPRIISTYYEGYAVTNFAT
jgi:hypothetical protein